MQLNNHGVCAQLRPGSSSRPRPARTHRQALQPQLSHPHQQGGLLSWAPAALQALRALRALWLLRARRALAQLALAQSGRRPGSRRWRVWPRARLWAGAGSAAAGTCTAGGLCAGGSQCAACVKAGAPRACPAAQPQPQARLPGRCHGQLGLWSARTHAAQAGAARACPAAGSTGASPAQPRQRAELPGQPRTRPPAGPSSCPPAPGVLQCTGGLRVHS